MMTDQSHPEVNEDLTGRDSFFFEIRVKTRLSAEQWMDWFDDLRVTFEKGETLLQGKAADHAALYGLIARLRDLAVPLLSVRVLDSDAQGRILLQSRRLEIVYTAMLGAIFAMVIGALSALAVFLSPSVLNVGLALAIMCALLGGLGHLFYFWVGKDYWHWLAHFFLAGSFVSFLAFIPTSGMLPTPIGIALMLLVAAGGVLVLSNAVRGWTDQAKAKLAGMPGPRQAADPVGSRPADANRES